MRLWLNVGAEAEREIVESVEQTGHSSTTYYVLLILSTIIAAFGLITNSTATVIGAMIVAPLMGPIVGLGLGLVRGDSRMVRRALYAEAAGVAVVLATSAVIALLVGVENVDFESSEIVGRTRPTLYDMAIGFAAGLAGAYATVNPRISASIAGVAIAVALVPPLAVSGLDLAGSLHHEHLAYDAFEAFMLFVANFLTIEVAAVLVFLGSGLGHFERLLSHRSLARAFCLNLLLLVGTAVFLAVQLNTLVAERALRERTRDYLASRIPALIPGASLADLTVALDPRTLRVNAVARASQEITPAMVAKMSRDLRKRLGLSRGVTLDLVVGTGLFTYVSPTGRLYVRQVEPDPTQVLNQRVDEALRSALDVYPRAELVEWQREDPSTPGRLLVTIRSPYVFDAWLVGELQRLATDSLDRLDQSAPTLTLTVRTTLGQDFTAEGSLQAPISELLSAEEQERLGLEQEVREILSRLVEEVPRSRLLSVEVVARRSRELQEGQAGPDPGAGGSPPGAEGGAPPGTQASASPMVQGSPPPTLPVSPSPAGARPSPKGPADPPPDGSDDVGAPEVAPTPLLEGRPVGLDVTATVRTPSLLRPHIVGLWQERLEAKLQMPVRLSVDNVLGEVVTPQSGPSPSPAHPPGLPHQTAPLPPRTDRTKEPAARSET